MERKEHKQLNINIIKQQPVISSRIVFADNFKNFKEVNTRKQNPRKLEEEFNICGDLLFFSFTVKNTI
ncbi:MAG: hypothetical protein ABI405_08065 [Parafilimonas sp.]